MLLTWRKQKMVKAEGNFELPEIQIDSYLVHNDLTDWLIIYKNHSPIKKYNFKRSLTSRVNWLENIVKEVGIATPKPLEIAKEKIINDEIRDRQIFESLISEAKNWITLQTMANEATISQYGAKFIESKRGPGKMTEMLDEELEKIIRELGLDCTANDIIDRIEKITENFHHFWQEVKREIKEIDYQDPCMKQGERTIKFSSLNNRISKIK